MDVKTVPPRWDDCLKKSVGPCLGGSPAVDGYARALDGIASPLPDHPNAQERGRHGCCERDSVG
jgi:hypothetical protein